MNTSIPFNPKVGRYRRSFLQLCAKIEASGARESDSRERAIADARSELLSLDRLRVTSGELRFATAISALLDLLEQGWDLHMGPNGMSVTPTGEHDEQPFDNKKRIRRAHQISRTAQIRQPAVRKFISSMESPRLTSTGWHSIYSLMRDGRKLAETLRTIRALQDAEAISKKLSATIDPYLQFVEADAQCAFTGLLLSDIWRYFRYTWVNPPQSVPGRSMRFLIRDRAAPNQPVIGLAALGSSTAQQTVRDEWIGWEGPRLAQWMADKSDQDIEAWIRATVRRLIGAIYQRDFVKRRVIRRSEISVPTVHTISKLRSTAAKAVQRHRLYPHLAAHKKVSGSRARWLSQAKTSLFTAKRAKTLASLLSVRLALIMQTKASRTNKGSAAALRKIASKLARYVKSEHVGLNMLDITTCGAIAPYNHLLGGKLVCLLLMSPEVRTKYQRRYGTRPSIIASSMRGAEVFRPCDLVLLMTTSLFGKSSSQYNRIRVRASDVIGKPNQHTLEYLALGRSIGFGSHHFSRLTTAFMEQLIGRASEGRKVNSIFGEGVNPLMRKIRDALSLLGLPGDLLRHGNPRIVYAVPLAKNFRQILYGEETKASYYLPNSAKATQLAAYWRKRWLTNRINSDDVIDRVSNETLTYPLAHNACVRRDEAFDEPYLFNLATDSPLARAS